MLLSNKNNLSLWAVLIFLLAAGFYLKIAWPLISPADGPEFATAAYTLGIGHPPGYPFWMLSGRLFTRLPLGNIGWRANLASVTAVCLAGTILFISASGLLTPSSALVSALVFLAALPVCQTAGGAEVYPQLILLVALLYYLLNKNSARSPLLFALLLGLGIGVHYLSLLFVPGWLILAQAKIKPSLKNIYSLTRKTLLGLLFAALGLTVFLIMPLRAAKVPYLSWGRVENLGNFQQHLARTVYQPMERGAKVDWRSRQYFTRDFFQSLLTEIYPYGSALLLVLGFLIILYQKDHRLILTVLTLLFLPVFLIIVLLRFQFNELNLSRLRNYYLPVYLIGAVVIGYGYQFWESKTKRLGKTILWALLLVFLGLFLARKYPEIDRSKSYQVLDLGENLLRQLPKYTIFLTKSDPVTFPLWFAQAVNNQRLDISVITTSFMQPSQFVWYRYHIRDFYPWMFVNPSESQLADKIQGINPWINEIIAKFADKQPIYYELNRDLLISSRYLFLDGTAYRVLLPPVAAAPKVKHTAWVVDSFVRQRGIKALPVYAPAKIHESAFVYAMTYFFLAENLRLNNQLTAARYYLEKAIAINQHNPIFKGSLGLVYEAGNEPEKAVKTYREILNQYPDYQLANLSMSRILSTKGDTTAARKYIAAYQKSFKK